jgi:fused signal recognition particle receptor
MDELAKLHRVTGASETLLVLDATGGQNGLSQVSEFLAAVPVTGVVLTKLDGTARGGVVVEVESRLGVPVKFIGDGEGLGDLTPFDPGRFVASLLADR